MPIDEFGRMSTQEMLKLGVLPNLPSTGVWNVRIRPNFSYGSGTYGPPQRIQVLNTSASSMLPEGAMESENRSVITGPEELLVYPNPCRGELVNVSMGDVQKGTLQLRVLDAASRVVTARAYTVEDSFNTELVFDEQLSAGVYMIEVTNAGSLQTQRLIVQ
jgi:hypothetical protein